MIDSDLFTIAILWCFIGLLKSSNVGSKLLYKQLQLHH